MLFATIFRSEIKVAESTLDLARAENIRVRPSGGHKNRPRQGQATPTQSRGKRGGAKGYRHSFDTPHHGNEKACRQLPASEPVHLRGHGQLSVESDATIH